MIRRLFFLLSFAWLVPGSSPATAAPVPAESDEWSMLASLMFSEAEDAFARSAATGDRWARLGHAAALLNHPPITPRKVNRVADDLRELVAETTDDEPARFARYLLVRLAHMHQASPLNEVEAGYRALLDQSPHVVAQLAAGKLAPLLIYERVDLAPAEGLAAATTLAPWADQSELPELSIAYDRVLAGGAFYHGLADADTLAWLLRADALDSSDPLTATTLHVQIAELARELGDTDLAATYYRRFLATAVPTDQRYRLVRERLEALTTADPPGQS